MATRLAICLLVLWGADPRLFATEFSARVADNLGNPVTGARVNAYCDESRADGSYKRSQGLFTLNSGPDGVVIGKYKMPGSGCEKAIRLRVQKEGYGTSLYGAFRDVYVVPRKVHADELHRIVHLSGADLNVALRNMLTSSVDGPFQELAFYYEDRLRPALRSLVDDPEAGIPARSLLAFIGVPEDLRLIARLGTPESQNLLYAHRWLYGVACSLLEPSTDAEWTLLRESALGVYKDLWVTRGAIQSLKLIASPRSRTILEEVQKANSFGSKFTARAIEYIQSNPESLRDGQLEELGRRVGKTLGSQTWTGNETPKYNQAGDKALIFLNFDTESDTYVYTATFQLVDEAWILRGVRETMQGLKGRAWAELVRKKK